MTRLIKILAFSLLLLAISCEDKIKEKEIGTVPSSFTKKVLIEEFTGAWCGYCPDGAYRLENIISENNGNVIGVSVHSGDDMEIEHTNFLAGTYQNTGFPAGMVDRLSLVDYYGNSFVSMSRGYWEYIANDQLDKTANCGLAIKSNVSGDNAYIEVHVGFNENLDGDLRLNVYIIEDKVTGTGYGYDQSNYYDMDSSSSFFGMGNPIEGYEHNHTLRAVLTESNGVIISSEFISSGEFEETFEFDISSFEKNKLSVVAFVNLMGTDFIEHEILNTQKCSIEGLQDWD